MYAVTSTYKNKIKENTRVFAIEIVINHSGGTLTLTDADIVEGSVLYTQKSQNGNDFACGGVVSNTLDFAIIRKPEYNTIDFTGAKVTAQVGLLLVEGYDEYTAFLNPNTPSYYPTIGDQFEWVPLGSFNVDIVTKLMTTMELKCADNMINLDESYSQSLLSYPATLEQIYLEICTFGDVSAVTTSFPNDSYTVPTKPTGEYSYRDILAWVAELSGTFAHINRSNGLELKWYGSTSVESYNGNHRFDYKVKEHSVQITGVMYSTNDTVYMTGTDNYVLDLSQNLLLQDNYATVLPNILSNIGGLVFNPFESNWQGNPALDVGDLVTHTASDTTVYIQPLTILKYKYRGKGYMGGEGQSQSEHNYKGSTDKRLEIIKKQIEDSVGNQITDLEQAILDATDLITTELGGYVLKRENELLIMDNPDPELAVKVWRWNLGGLGYSTTGVNGTYGTAITMNGAIVANYITTGTLSADRVRTGLLSSVAGNSYFDLNNGIVRVSHGGTEYSQMDVNGFKRQWQYGEAKYLNDLYVQKFYELSDPLGTTAPSPYRIYLPASFRGRSNVSIIPIPMSFKWDIGDVGSDGLLNDFVDDIYIIWRVATVSRLDPTELKDLNATTPWVDIDVYSRVGYDQSLGPVNSSEFFGIDWVLLVVGY